MIDRLGISIFWLFLGCVKALIVALDVVMGLLVRIAGECNEEANRDCDGVGRSDSIERGAMDCESNEEGDWH